MASTTDQLYGEKGKETMARAMFSESKALENPNQRMARELREHKDAGESPPTVLESLAIKPLSSTEVKGAIDKAVHGEWKDETDAYGKTQRKIERKGEDLTHFRTAFEAAEFVQEFLKNDYGSLLKRRDRVNAVYIKKDPETGKDSTTRVNIDAYLTRCRESAYKAIQSFWPEAQVALDNAGAGQDKMLDRMLKDPKFAIAVRTRLQAVIDSASTSEEVPVQLKDQVGKAKLDYDTKEKELAWLSDDLIKKEEEYEREFGTPITGSKGDILAKLPSNDILDLDIAKENKLIKDKRREITRLEAPLKTAHIAKDTGEVTRISGEMAAHQQAIDEAEDRKSEAEKKKLQRTEIEAAEKRLKGEREQLKRDVQKKQLERDEAQNLWFLSQAGIDEKEEDRKRAQKSFVSKMEGVMGEATREYLTQQMGDYEKARDHLIEGKGEEAYEQGLLNRWNKKDKKGELNKDVIDSDYDLFLKDGAGAVVRKLLTSGEHGMTATQLEARLAKEPDFLKNKEAEVIERLLTRRLQTGKITDKEARRIIDMEGSDEIITRAIEMRAKYDGDDNAIAELRKAGLLGGELKRKLRALADNKLVRMLMLIFGLGGIFAVDALGGFGIATAVGGKAIAGATSIGHAAAVGADKVAPFVSHAAANIAHEAAPVIDKAGNVVSDVVSHGEKGATVLKDKASFLPGV